VKLRYKTYTKSFVCCFRREAFLNMLLIHWKAV